MNNPDLNDKWKNIPAVPVVTTTAVPPMTAVTAVVDEGETKLDVSAVHAWFSTDDGFIYGSVELEPYNGSDTVYYVLGAFTMQANTVMCVDVTYKTTGLLGKDVFTISSEPVLPSGFVPHIRDMSSCL